MGSCGFVMEIVAGVARPTAGAPVIIEKMNQGRGDRRRLRGLSAVEKTHGKNCGDIAGDYLCARISAELIWRPIESSDISRHYSTATPPILPIIV